MNAGEIYHSITGIPLQIADSDLLDLLRNSEFLSKSRETVARDAKQSRIHIAKLLQSYGLQQFDDLCQGPAPSKIKDIASEMEWHFECLILCSSEITQFNQSRKEFGKYFLLGEYSKAELVLNQIQQRHGICFYYIEKAILLEQAREGASAARRLAESFVANFKHQGLHVVTNLFRLRTEGLLLQWPFEQYLKSLFQLNEDEFSPLTIEEVVFYSDSLTTLQRLSDLPQIIRCLNRYSTVDRYLGVLRCSRILFHEWPPSHPILQRLRAIIIVASQFIADDHLRCLIKAVDNDGIVKLNLRELEFLELQGLYLAGNFEVAANQAQVMLHNDPTNPFLYDILAKSIVHCPTVGVTIGALLSGLARRIVTLLINLYSEQGAGTIITAELDAIAVAVGDNHLSHFVRSIAQRYRGFKSADSYFGYGSLNRRINADSLIFEISLSKNLSNCKLPSSAKGKGALACAFFEAVKDGNTEDLDKLRDSVHPVIFCVVKAKIFAENRDWEKVIVETNEIDALRGAGKSSDLRWVRQLAVLRLEALLRVSRWKEAKDLFEQSIYSLSNFAAVGDLSQFKELMNSSEDRSFFELEILVIDLLQSADFHQRALVLRSVIQQFDSGLRAPSLFLNRKGWSLDPLARKVFLVLVPPEVLKYLVLDKDPEQNSTDAAYDEFVNICMEFLSLDESDASEQVYLELIDAFARKRERSVRLVVDGARIVISIERIRSEICAVISSMVQTGNSGENPETSSDKYELIKRCFELVRTEFLYNDKHGFVRSLGNRIRHGFFFNTLYDVIEESGLAAKTPDRPNENWSPPDLDRMGIVVANYEQKLALEQLLIELTKGLLRIVESFRDHEIAMRRHDSLGDSPDEDNSTSGRCFEFDDLDELARKAYSSKLSESQTIFDWSIDILRRRLDEALFKAQSLIMGDLSERFQVLIETFEGRVSGLNLPTASEQQLIAITKGLVGALTAKCSIIANWFRVADSERVVAATIVDVMNAVAKGAQAKRSAEPLVRAETDIEGSRSSIEAWFHILYILFDNARKASSGMVGNGNIELYVSKGNEGEVLVGCENNLQTESEAKRAIDRINGSLNSLEKVKILDIEGTGLKRARDLLADLDNLGRNLYCSSKGSRICVEFALKVDIDENSYS